jgi:hypothetical protein
MAADAIQSAPHPLPEYFNIGGVKMSRLFLTPARVRSVIGSARTEKDISDSLRLHHIRFHWTTAPGFLAASVPVRSGTVIIYRTASRSAPFVVRFITAPLRSALVRSAPVRSAPASLD